MRTQLDRQLAHWTAATLALQDLSRLAAPSAWSALGNHLGLELRRELLAAVQRLRGKLEVLRAELAVANAEDSQLAVARSLRAFRRDYLRVERTLDFFGDAINTRTSPELGGLLRACDALATRAMAQVLEPLGVRVPAVLTYLQYGLGAAVLKAELPLWDPATRLPVAAVKVTRHNLLRPTALIHEAGHQVAHLLRWAPEMARVLAGAVPGDRRRAARWSAWASEILGDLFAFVHTGYAAVATLHDVVASDAEQVTQLNELDPHPPGWLRVLLGCAMCRASWGAGPWDALERDWRAGYPLAGVAAERRQVLEACAGDLSAVAEALLGARYRALGGRQLTAFVDPARVSPASLRQLEQQGGAALFVSSQWVAQECLRLLALSGFKLATDPATYPAATEQQRAWMEHLARLTHSA